MAGQVVNRGKNVWLVRVFIRRDEKSGKREYANRTVHGGKKDAERVLNDMLRERDASPGGRRVIANNVNSLLDALVSDYRINGKSVGWCETLVEVHLRPFFGKLPASKVDSALIRSYIEKRKRPDAARGRGAAANATINHELALLRRAFNLAAADDPPRIARVPKIPALEENNTRKGFFEYGQYSALFEALPDHIRPVLSFGYYTGCRRGEILGLRWDQVDLIRGMVRLEPGETKNEEAREIPLVGDLLALLRLRRETRDSGFPDCPWVFFHDDGKQIRSIKNAWANACKRAGLWDESTQKPTRLFHDLRRSGVRNLVRAGVSEKVAQRISGHKTRAVFDRYNITTQADLFDAVAKQQAFMDKTKQAHNAAASDNRHTIGTQSKKATKN